MEQTEKAYYAGLFDGEGTITLQPTKISSRNQRRSYFLSIQLTSTDEERILELQAAFGGWIATVKRQGNRKPAIRWIAARSQAEDFLLAVLPFLRIKKHRAELALEFHAHKKRGGYHTQKYIDFEEDYKRTFLKLNHRGKISGESCETEQEI